MTSRVKGPGDGPSPIGAPEDVGAPEAAHAPAEAKSTTAVQSTEATSATGATDPISQIAGELRAGRITVADAVERLIEDAVHRQIGRALEGSSNASMALADELRALLHAYAANDPFLAARIRRLNLAK